MKEGNRKSKLRQEPVKPDRKWIKPELSGREKIQPSDTGSSIGVNNQKTEKTEDLPFPGKKLLQKILFWQNNSEFKKKLAALINHRDRRRLLHDFLQHFDKFWNSIELKVDVGVALGSRYQ